MKVRGHVADMCLPAPAHERRGSTDKQWTDESLDA